MTMHKWLASELITHRMHYENRNEFVTEFKWLGRLTKLPSDRPDCFDWKQVEDVDELQL